MSRNCKLCGQHQTLLHVLNHCPVALQLRRFNRRHDAVLTVIADLIRAHKSPSQNLIIDVPGMNYYYPQHISTTDSRPDIVLWQDNPREVNLMELTVCFETNFDEVRRRKVCRYADLIEEAEHRGYQASLITVEVWSRAILDIAGLDKVKSLLGVRREEWATFMVDLSRMAIQESHKIWVARNGRGESENIHVP